MAASKGSHPVYKSAVSGRFVTKAHVVRSPKTTFVQQVPNKGK